MNAWLLSALVAGGGAVGALARFWTSVAAATLFGSAVLGTLTVNVFGGFLIGLLAGSGAAGDLARAALMAGVLGGFTTFSAFSLETLRFLEAGRLTLAALYVVGSVGLSIGASATGLWAARYLA